jgi:hypothetical protein
MPDLRKMVHWEITNGDTITVGDTTVTPQSRALVVHWANGGLVWNRPVAVLVKNGEQTRRIPIVDATRRAQLAILGIGLLFFVMTLLAGNRE